MRWIAELSRDPNCRPGWPALLAFAEGAILAVVVCAGFWVAGHDPYRPLNHNEPFRGAVAANASGDMALVVALCGIGTSLRLNHPGGRGRGGRCGHVLAVLSFFLLAILHLLQAISWSLHLYEMLAVWKWIAATLLLAAGLAMSWSMVSVGRCAASEADELRRLRSMHLAKAQMADSAVAQIRREAT